MSTRPIGPLLDALDVTADLTDADQIVEVMVIAKVANFDTGRTALSVSHNEIDWIAQLGLLAAAGAAVSPHDLTIVDHDDE